MQTRNPPARLRHGRWPLGAAALLIAGGGWAETGTVLKATELRKEPQPSAEVLKQLAAKDSVEVSSRKGAWAQVATPEGLAGWIRLLNLRTGSGEQARAGFGKVASMFTTGSSGSAASTGVKGLSAGSLRQASPNWTEFDKLEGFVAADADAKSFAGAAGLRTQSLEFFPDEADKKGGR